MRNDFSCLLSSSKFPDQFFLVPNVVGLFGKGGAGGGAKSMFSLAGSTAHSAWDLKVRLCSFLACASLPKISAIGVKLTILPMMRKSKQSQALSPIALQTQHS